ncbi:MAG: immunoglobulin domain-containing protein, partial [Verrucomicrobia bacterium]|nr:immunoglobulin domain-containing protein [Verrucomicrobiota bacterium]
LKTEGSSFETALGVYVGSVLTQLQPIAEAGPDSAPGRRATIEFAAVGGQEYVFLLNPARNSDIWIAALSLHHFPFTPIITQAPHPIEVAPNDPASISVVADRAPPLFYQWFKNDVPIAGATQSDLIFGSFTTNDTGGYSVMVSNRFGTVTTAKVPAIAGYRLVVTKTGVGSVKQSPTGQFFALGPT